MCPLIVIVGPEGFGRKDFQGSRNSMQSTVSSGSPSWRPSPKPWPPGGPPGCPSPPGSRRLSSLPPLVSIRCTPPCGWPLGHWGTAVNQRYDEAPCPGGASVLAFRRDGDAVNVEKSPAWCHGSHLQDGFRSPVSWSSCPASHQGWSLQQKEQNFPASVIKAIAAFLS